MATTTYGTEYVQSSDLVSNWPGSSLSVANRIDNVSLVGNGVNNQTGTTYTLVLADGGKLVTFSNAAAVSLTVPTNASVAFPTGVRIKLTNKGAGTVTVAGAGGVTLNGNQLTIAQNRSAMLYKLDTNTWVMTADPSIPSDPGLAFITSNTFTASTAVNVNNCFTATYQNYRILIDLSAASATGFTNLQLTASGTASTTGYSRSAGYTAYTSSTPQGESQNNSSSYNLVYSTTANGGVAIVDLMRPAQAVRTYIAQQIINFGSNGGWGSGEHAVSTAYDGFVLTAGSGTITGTLRIYGYRNS